MERRGSLENAERLSGRSSIRTEYPAAFRHVVATKKDAQLASPALAGTASLPTVPEDAGDDTAAPSEPDHLDEVVKDLECLVKLLMSEKIPGPQLFRLRTEFSQLLGQGTEGRVWGVHPDVHERIPADLAKRWPTRKIAIKNHDPRADDPRSTASNKLRNYIAAASAEILALSPSRIGGHPNIVRLFGWGLCLDTLESGPDPATDPCCLSMQLPLLVLERAEGNFQQFLMDVFDMPRKCAEARAEAGTSRWTAEGSQNSEYCPNFGIPERVDRCELVRLLCIDIGHGLEFLHDNGVTHGDLKPCNVLVFRQGPTASPIFTAKLCDFGHAEPPLASHGGSPPEDASSSKSRYRGTADWKPEWFDPEKTDFETLRDYDLMVYGLVVWSAFCHGGGAVPRERWLTAPLRPEDVDNFVAFYHDEVRKRTRASCLLPRLLRTNGPQRDGQLQFSPSLSRGIRRVIHDTVYQGSKQQDKRVLHRQPWRHLYRKREWILQPLIKIRGHRPAARKRGDALDAAPRPDPEPAKASVTIRGTRDFLTPHAKTRTPRPMRRFITLSEGLVPVGTTAFQARAMAFLVFPSNDESFRYLDEKFRIPTDDVHRALFLRALFSHRNNRAAELYHYARYRARRVSLADWQQLTPPNIVQTVLQRNPGVDVCAIAWACHGEVGQDEVRRLRPEFEVWGALLDPGQRPGLDDSGRLERFLVLLQHGARIEQLMKHPNRKHMGKRSILTWFLLGCRTPTLPFVAREISSRFVRAMRQDKANVVAASTRRYMTTAGNSFNEKEDSFRAARGISAMLDLQLDADEYGVAYEYMRVEFSAMLHMTAGHETGRQHVESDEVTPLLPTPRVEAQAPPGWIIHRGSSTAFEEGLTKSITLRKPTFQPSELSNVKLGHRAPAAVERIHSVNVIGIVELGRAAISWREGDDLERRIRERFPTFDDEWYESEHRAEMPRNNVLAELQDLQPVASFTSRIPGFWFNALFWGFRIVLLILLLPVTAPLMLLALAIEVLIRGVLLLVKFSWSAAKALVAVALFVVVSTAVIGLVVAVAYVSLPLLVGGVILFGVATLGSLPLSDDNEAPWTLVRKLGAAVLLSSPVVATLLTVYLFGWLCANAADGRWLGGSMECKRCLWVAVSYPLCTVDERL